MNIIINLMTNKGKEFKCLFECASENVLINNDGSAEDILHFSDDKDLSFSFENSDLIINYDGENTVRIQDYLLHSDNEYIQIKNNKKLISDYFTSISRGETAEVTSLTTDSNTILCLKNTFDGKDYIYFLSSTVANSETVTFNYLENNRLVITGNKLEITSHSGQNDNFILLGNNNKVYTLDGVDTVRAGYVADGNCQSYYTTSSYNTIETGSGNDYVILNGFNNNANTADDIDVVSYSTQGYKTYNNVSNCETIKAQNSNSESINNGIEYFSQGYSGGDCRLLALIQSLYLSPDFTSLDDYVIITDNANDSYTVTFGNYQGAGNNSVTIQQTDIDSFHNVFGDLDVVLIDYAMNTLIEENRDYGKTNVVNAYYNTIANYMLGSSLMSYHNMTNSYINTFETLWQEYLDGVKSNLTVNIYDETNYDLGIISGHAYAVKDIDFTNNCIYLSNPWDTADELQLDLDYFYSLDTAVVGYGYGKSTLYSNGEYTPMDASYMDTIVNDIIAWDNSFGTTENYIGYEEAQDNVDLTVYFSNIA